MKATHNKASEGKVEWKFPCLGVAADGELILFEKEKSGTVLIKATYPVGHHSNNWSMAEFTPIPSTESVTLQND